DHGADRARRRIDWKWRVSDAHRVLRYDGITTLPVGATTVSSLELGMLRGTSLHPHGGITMPEVNEKFIFNLILSYLQDRLKKTNNHPNTNPKNPVEETKEPSTDTKKSIRSKSPNYENKRSNRLDTGPKSPVVKTKKYNADTTRPQKTLHDFY